MQISFHVTARPLPKCILSVDEEWARLNQGERNYARTRNFHIVFLHVHVYDHTLRPRNMVQGFWTPLTQMHSVREVWARLDKRERRYAPDKMSRTDRRTDNHKSPNWSRCLALKQKSNLIEGHVIDEQKNYTGKFRAFKSADNFRRPI